MASAKESSREPTRLPSSGDRPRPAGEAGDDATPESEVVADPLMLDHMARGAQDDPFDAHKARTLENKDVVESLAAREAALSAEMEAVEDDDKEAVVEFSRQPTTRRLQPALVDRARDPSQS